MLRQITKNAKLARRCYSDRPEPWQMDKLTDIGARKIFNEDHDILRESVRKFWTSIDHADKMRWEEQGFVDKEFWKVVGAQGLIGVETAEDKGGWGGDFYQNIIGLEEQIYQMVPGLFNLQSDLVMPYILSDQICHALVVSVCGVKPVFIMSWY